MDDNLKYVLYPSLINRNSAIRLFLVISEMNDLFFAPSLPIFVIALLFHISEEDVYCVRVCWVYERKIINSILDSPVLRKKYLISNQRYYEAFLETTTTINEKCPSKGNVLLVDRNPENAHFCSQHPSIYGYIVRSWMSTFCFSSIPWDICVRLIDAFVCSGIWVEIHIWVQCSCFLLCMWLFSITLVLWIW